MFWILPLLRLRVELFSLSDSLRVPVSLSWGSVLDMRDNKLSPPSFGEGLGADDTIRNLSNESNDNTSSNHRLKKCVRVLEVGIVTSEVLH